METDTADTLNAYDNVDGRTPILIVGEDDADNTTKDERCQSVGRGNIADCGNA